MRPFESRLPASAPNISVVVVPTAPASSRMLSYSSGQSTTVGMSERIRSGQRSGNLAWPSSTVPPLTSRSVPVTHEPASEAR